MATGDERLLVGRRDDLAGPQRGQDRPKADDATRPDHDEVDVVAGGQPFERVRPADAFRAGRQVQPGERRAVTQRDRGRTEARGLLGEEAGVRAGRERDDPEGLRMRVEDLDRLAADRAGRAEERDAARPVPRSGVR